MIIMINNYYKKIWKSKIVNNSLNVCLVRVIKIKMVIIIKKTKEN